MEAESSVKRRPAVTEGKKYGKTFGGSLEDKIA